MISKLTKHNFLIFLILLLTFFIRPVLLDDYNEDSVTKINETDVSKWADSIGEELWEIGRKITNLDAIKRRYNDMNATVQPTDGDIILKTIVSRMNKLIKEKVDAVLRIRSAAVMAESQFNESKFFKNEVVYPNSKFSNCNVSDSSNITLEANYTATAGHENSISYANMTLYRSSHFKDVLVNTSYSSVHVPTNIYDKWDKVIQPIHWSADLDYIFKENYEKDPSLMWQYFASTSGFLRHYPAFHWSMVPDKYDCRKSIWYIQAATCSKEVIVLIDNSGTMYGMRNTIAQLTVDSLLQTFSNNDYVNIFRLYEDNVTCLVPCFNDTLIQATPENVELFKQALYDMCPEKKINFTKGFLKAFEMLHDFLENKTEQTEKRNQAIFLLTDMLPPQNEMLNILKEYRKIYNDTHIQVELFIYFIGRDVPEIRVVQWEKCLRNGSIVHVRTMDEVPEDVLKYLPVMARTQNENTEDYPISWTHVFLDIKKDKGKLTTNNINDGIDSKGNEIEEHPEYGNLSEPHIMTSVTTPVYRINKPKKKSSEAEKEGMIGVAAIDVPVSDFEKLTIPHKIGVNGYAFIVTNNGYLLFHPDLTPVKDGKFRENFNSVDLTEVEFYDDIENEARKPNEHIVELRKRMVNQEVGNKSNMAIKFHYDKQKRVGSELRNYFFAPLKCSPFTLGLALPRGYGNYWIKTADEIETSRIKEENYSNFFTGDWNIHPKWTYCDFRDERKYSFKNPKEKLSKFFDMIFDESANNFTWNLEHPGENINNLSFADPSDSCFMNDTTQKPTEDYFCDKELMELLFFDAKLTHHEFNKEISKDDEEYIRSKNILLKFVSTQSGLTRWKYFDKKNSIPEDFGETNNKALDEVWYKSAVLLHQLKSRNFVFSLPEALGDSNQKYITASHAIFHNDTENEAPGVVVGFQIAYITIKKLIENITLCGRSHSDCYIIDANGYVVYAQNDKYLGKFFGEVEGAVMEQMITSNIFRKLSMFDYQAFDEVLPKKLQPKSSNSNASIISKPFMNLLWMIKWTYSKILWLLLEISLVPRIYASTGCNILTPTNKDDVSNVGNPPCRKAPKEYSNEGCRTREIPPHIEELDENSNRAKKMPVDKRFFLYLYTNLSADGYVMSKNGPNENCSRPFFANRIIYTNLILISVDTTYQTCFKNVTVSQTVIEYPTPNKTIPACNKKMINSYPRKKLRGCSTKALEVQPTNETCGSTQIFLFSVCMRLIYCVVLPLCNYVFIIS